MAFCYFRLRPLFALLFLIPFALSAQSQAIKDSYIITLNPGIDTAQFTAHTAWVKQVHTAAIARSLDFNVSEDNDGEGKKDKHRKIEILTGVERVFDVAGFKGYSGKFDKATLEEIRKSRLVSSIEQNYLAYPQVCTTQSTPDIWGLHRISHIYPSGSNPVYQYVYDKGPYDCCTPSGGPWIYVLDTGINLCHEDFGNRATFGIKVNNEWSNEDTCGHGTHVAATAIGSQFGVMKNARAISVKVLGGSGCNGSIDGIMEGLQWAFRQASAEGKLSCSVINMSLVAGSVVRALDDLVNSVVARGLTVVVAAGNGQPVGQPVDACNYSPARAERAITVGATDIYDQAAYYSNYGSCIDIFAPGSDILSAYSFGCKVSQKSTGTSMASPHVAGMILYGKSLHCWANPDQDRSGILKYALSGVIKRLGPRSVNLLLSNGGCQS